MATAEEILLGTNRISPQSVGSETVDNTLYIDFDTREIKIPKTVMQLGVESDDDVNKLTFSIPRLYKDTDLSKFNIYINYMNSKKEGDLFKVLPEKVTIDENDNLIFDWVVGRQAVAYKGTAIFNICMKKISDTETDEEGNPIVEQEFNTTIAKLPVLEGLETGEAVVQEYADILVQWEEMLFGIEDSAKKEIILKGSEVVQAVKTEGETQRAAIIQKGKEVTDTITAKKTEFDTDAATQLTTVNTAGETQRTAIIQKGSEVVQAVQTEGESQRTAIIQKGSEVLQTLDEQVPAGIENYISSHPDEFKGDKGDKGDPGEKGDDGKSIGIKGSYSTEAELRVAHPTGTNGEGYMINGDLYIWDVDLNDWSNVGRIQGPAGTDGTDGTDGVSPSVSTSKSGLITTVKITDATGEHIFTVSDGVDGKDGTDGQDGQDGVSPSVSTSKTGKVATVTITDATGEHIFEIRDGVDGTGSGDMNKATYDTNDDGIVDKADDANKLGGVASDKYALKTDIPEVADTAKDSEKLGGQLPAYYAKATDIPSEITATNDGNGNITILLGGGSNG